MSQGWQGDALYALQDCEVALEASPTGFPTAHVRRIRALMQLKQLQVGGKDRAFFIRKTGPTDIDNVAHSALLAFVMYILLCILSESTGNYAVC